MKFLWYLFLIAVMVFFVITASTGVTQGDEWMLIGFIPAALIVYYFLLIYDKGRK